MPADDLGWLDAVALRDLVADGEVTPAELAEAVVATLGSLARTNIAGDVMRLYLSHVTGITYVCDG